MATDLRFSGQVAQLGRPGVVQDVSNKLVDQFAECIKAQLSASPEEAAAAVVEAQKPVSGFSLAIAALASAIKRLFGRGHGRERGDRREAHHGHGERRHATSARWRSASSSSTSCARGSA